MPSALVHICGPESLVQDEFGSRTERVGAACVVAESALTQREIESVVGAIFDSITDQLAHGGRVELRGFGAFSTRQRDARIGRNPRTGAAVEVDAKRVPYFKPGKEMRERLNLQDVTAE